LRVQLQKNQRPIIESARTARDFGTLRLSANAEKDAGVGHSPLPSFSARMTTENALRSIQQERKRSRFTVDCFGGRIGITRWRRV
jgi:hypothetical protein